MNKVVTSGVQIILGTILIICAMLPQEKQTIDPTKTKQDLPQKSSIPFAGLIAGAGVFITLKGLGELYFGWVKADDTQDIQQADHQPQYRSPPAYQNRQPQAVPPTYQNHQSQPVQPAYQNRQSQAVPPAYRNHQSQAVPSAGSNRQSQPTYHQSQQTYDQSQRVQPASQNQQQPVSPAYPNHQRYPFPNNEQPVSYPQPNYQLSQEPSPFEEDLWDTQANSIEDEPLTFHNLPVHEQSQRGPVDPPFPTVGAGATKQGPVDQPFLTVGAGATKRGPVNPTFLDETAGYSYAATGGSKGETEHTILLTEQLQHNILSWVLSGLPGAGKTTILRAWLAQTVKYSKDVQFFINGWKGDDWLGLAAISGVYKRNYRDKSNQPVLDGFFSQVNAVSNILHQRLPLAENQRNNLPKVWLVLDDFFATSNILNRAKKELAEAWETAKGQMGEIITLGREVGVGLCVATQSLNVQSLGCDDANIRGCLGICALGKIYTDSNGRREGGYSPITNAWKNTYIIPSEYVGQVTSSFNKLRPISERTGYAIVLTTFGEPSIGIFTEDLSWVKDYKIPVNIASPIGSNVVKFPTEPTKISPITPGNFDDDLELDEDLEDEPEDESSPERFIY